MREQQLTVEKVLMLFYCFLFLHMILNMSKEYIFTLFYFYIFFFRITAFILMICIIFKTLAILQTKYTQGTITILNKQQIAIEKILTMLYLTKVILRFFF